MKVIGHRGTRGTFIENTLEGFVKTFNSGCYGIELDINITENGYLYIHHDPYIKPENEEISLFNWQEKDFNNFDLNQLYGPKTENKVTIPSFKETLELLKNQTFLLLEVKSSPNWVGKFQLDYTSYAQAILKEIAVQNLNPSTFMLQSFDPQILDVLYRLAPAYNYGLLIEEEKILHSAFEKLSFTPQFFNPEHILLSEDFTKEVHNRNALCYTWTVNDLKLLKNLNCLKVDGVITDFPHLFQKNIGL